MTGYGTDSSEDIDALWKLKETAKELKNAAIILSPLGKIFTISVPFPCLLRYVHLYFVDYHTILYYKT